MTPSYGSKEACPEASSRDHGCGVVVAVATPSTAVVDFGILVLNQEGKRRPYCTAKGS